MLCLTFTVMIVEAIFAWVTGSLALLADAAHMLSDSFGIVLALLAITIAQGGGGPKSRRTFGNHRTEVIAAGINGLVLLGLSVWVVYSAVRRFGDPPALDGGLVLVAGAVGLVANLVGLVLLRPSAEESINVRGAYLEVLGDAFGSVAVLVSATIVLTTGWDLADPLASLLIAALIIPRAVSLLWDVAEVLLESTPRGVDLEDLRQHIAETEGVKDVHDLHVWTITSGMPIMSAHVVVEDDVIDMDQAHAVLDRLRGCLSEHFDVEHSTFQIEPSGHADQESRMHH
ncbi:cation diffusion facilitator family transporter [soil metagenome]